MTNLADQLIKKYYNKHTVARKYLYEHSLSVARLAVKVAENNPQLTVNHELLINMAMLHDIGIFLTDAPKIGCHGQFPYIVHGVLGRVVLETEKLYEIAPVCERHVGVGFTTDDIINSKLPFPLRNMLPLSIEERIVCFADKFYSKKPGHINTPKSLESVKKKISSYGEDQTNRFQNMLNDFGYNYVYS